ncbi:MAG: Essential protein Yae1, N terminal [Peltula sp. TS41687]|nr:MAG: Essential protein Yae1, N terminal [Peltula sp. TS41687]
MEFTHSATAWHPISATETSTATEDEQEPSDLPRLQATHSKAGYVDGITQAKSSSVQEGFDEGYPLGAAYGAQVGLLRGVFEGILAAVGSTQEERERKRVEATLERLKAELSSNVVVERLVGGEDGVKGTVVVEELRKSWMERVEEEAERWGIRICGISNWDVQVARKGGGSGSSLEVEEGRG